MYTNLYAFQSYFISSLANAARLVDGSLASAVAAWLVEHSLPADAARLVDGNSASADAAWPVGHSLLADAARFVEFPAGAACLVDEDFSQTVEIMNLSILSESDYLWLTL